MTAAAEPAPQLAESPVAKVRTRRPLHTFVPPWLGALLVTAALVALTGYLSPTFLKPQNLMDIVGRQAPVGILAVGMTLVIVAGGIDLSVGSLLALAGGCGILLLEQAANVWHWPGWLATAAAGAVTCLAGLAAGLLNGVLVAKGRLPAFIATLAALLAFRAGTQWIANGGQFHTSEPVAAFKDYVGGGYAIPNTDVSVSRRPNHAKVPLTVPYEVVVWAAVAVAGMVLLNRGRLGRYAIAVGSNARAARYSAVPVARVRIWVYAISGLLAGVAGFMEAARYDSVNSGQAGLYFELFAIAAAVIGGTRMEGGSGSVLGSVLGTLLLGVIFNVIINLPPLQVGGHAFVINSQAQGVVTGAVIVVAALIQRGGARD